jgi:hypothetical protein
MSMKQLGLPQANRIEHLGKHIDVSDVSHVDGKTQCLDDCALSSEMSLP